MKQSLGYDGLLQRSGSADDLLSLSVSLEIPLHWEPTPFLNNRKEEEEENESAQSSLCLLKPIIALVSLDQGQILLPL